MTVQVKLAPRPYADYGDEDEARSEVADALAWARSSILAAAGKVDFSVHRATADLLMLDESSGVPVSKYDAWEHCKRLHKDGSRCSAESPMACGRAHLLRVADYGER